MTDRFLNNINTSLSESIKDRVKEHRLLFNSIITSRYIELLPFLITYDSSISTIDFIELETLLRYGKNVVIGETASNEIKILGYTNTPKLTFGNLHALTNKRRLIKDDIVFTIDEKQILNDYTEIIDDDNARTGNFIVVKNKLISYVDDFSIIKYYARELSEIALSRYSIILQMKINTFFVGDVGDETINELVEDVYNGSPFVKVTKFFDKDENIVTLNNFNMAQTLVELKREYQNKISELNTMLGIYNTAVDKEGGISPQELNTSQGFTASNANVYLSSREKSFNLLNKRYGSHVKPKFNDMVSSELNQLMEGLPDENNNNLQDFN